MSNHSIEKLKSKRNHVVRQGDIVHKTFHSAHDCEKEYQIYKMLEETNLSPMLIEQYDRQLHIEYIRGDLFLDLLEKNINNPKVQLDLFGMFFDWYEQFYKKTGCILGDSNFKNFILKKRTLYGFDFETCKKGHPIDDIVWQTAMLASLSPAFSYARKSMARRFLSMGIQRFKISNEQVSFKIETACKIICKRRHIFPDVHAIKEITASVDIAACLLAGGKSSRMHTDKRFLPYAHQSLIQIAAESVQLFPYRYLSLSKPDEKINFPTFEYIYDEITDCGPMGGIVQALIQSKCPWTLFITSDMPFVRRDIVDYLIDFCDENQDVILFSKQGKPKIFPMLLKTEKALPVFSKALQNQELKLQKAMEDKLNILHVAVEECPFYTPFLLENINTKDDYEKLSTIK